MEKTASFHIDVQEIIDTKAPAMSKKIPRFVVGWLAKIIRQDDVNQLLIQSGHKTGVDFMDDAVKYFRVNLAIKGEENLPDANRKCIFVSNHPLGGMDGICLSSYLGNSYNKCIKYLVNDILYFIRPLQNIFVPINKHGRQGRKVAGAVNEAFESDNQIITFPAGLCSRKKNGKIRDLKWEKMFITKSVEYQRDVVPVYFEAKNSNFFYNFANIRKALRIKFNIEMLFLPRELFKIAGSTFTIHIGKPIPWQTFDSSKKPQEWANWVNHIVYNTIEINK